ncbi:hypothetical protein [Streptomyces sp. NPDC050856]|uniref:hypothetical protein n=1 Tax=Streptomyces sp. NPDC050856 TaxID=3154939 RepID=UPI0033CE6FDF
MPETSVQAHRTPQSVRRRRLQDAAVGRSAVVLYVCTQDPLRTATQTLTDLSGFAAARDWDVAAVVCDPSALRTPADSRTQWTAVRAAITSGRAEGVVALSEHAGSASSEQTRLRQWLAEHAAFLVLVPSSHSGAEAGR